MKLVFIGLIYFFSLEALANDFISGRIESVYCGEVDPFVVGDACIVLIRDNNYQKIGLYFNDYNWIDINAPHFDLLSLQGLKAGAYFCESLVGGASEAQNILEVLRQTLDSEASFVSCYPEDFVYL